MKEFDIEVKRFYVPVVLKEKCPKCSKEIVNDYSQDYLSYPTANKEMDTYFYCEDCDEEFYIKTILEVSLKKVSQ